MAREIIANWEKAENEEVMATDLRRRWNSLSESNPIWREAILISERESPMRRKWRERRRHEEKKPVENEENKWSGNNES